MPTTKTAETTLYEALMNAQRAFGPVLKNAQNPHLKSKYADLGSVIETISEPLNDNGLLFFQTIQPGADVPELVTSIVLAATGDKIESRAPLVSKDPNNPQAFGAALTYMRRYSLLAMCGLAPEDDDGHAATKPGPKVKQAISDAFDDEAARFVREKVSVNPHTGDVRRTSDGATSQRPQTRQHGSDEQPTNSPLLPSTANEREEMTDAEFDEEVRKALATKDGQRFAQLAEDAGKYTSRWLVLIRNCETPQSLDWIERQIERKGMGSELLTHEITKRRAEVEAGVGAF